LRKKWEECVKAIATAGVQHIPEFNYLHYVTNKPLRAAGAITVSMPELNSMKSASMPSLKITPKDLTVDASLRITLCAD